MSTNRPTPSAQIVAIATTLALIVITFVIALAAFAAGAYPHRSVEEPAPAATQAPASQVVEESREAVETSPAGLIDPSTGRGADSPTCKHSPKSPRCRLEGGAGLSRTRGGHALRPATDGPEVLLDSEWDETGPADMPGRAPGRGGWVGEEGPSRA
jgi:hypothetical protein